MSLAWLRRVELQLAVCGVVVAVYAATAGTPYALRVLGVAGIYALVTLGYQLIFGHAGALALSQGTFMGVGAYVSGILAAKFGWGFDASLPFAIALPLLLAVIVAVPVLRLQSHYFALSTLIIAHIVLLIAIQWVGVTGGANGIGGIRGLSLFGWPIRPGGPALAVVWGSVALGAGFAWLFARGLLGRAFALMRVNGAAAGSIGIDTARLRFAAFLLSAVYGGWGGALYVHTIRVISPEVLELPVMVTILTIAVVGGRTRIAGVIAAAVLIVELPEWFRFLHQYYLIAYGVILLAVIVAAPDGLAAAVQRFWLRFGDTPLKTPPQPMALPPVRTKQHTSGEPLLALAGLSRRFGGVRALDDVSFEIGRGELVGLIGPNGSGKTTLVNTVSGLYRPDSGRVSFAGADITHAQPYEIARGGIARTFQTVALVDDMSALDNVAIARGAGRRIGLRHALSFDLRDRVLARARSEAMGFLDQMGVGEQAMLPCGALAYGLRRRVEIARALATEPRLLLLDEPAAGLNESEQADLATRLRRAAEHSTLLVIEHNMPFLLALVDRLICLDYGRVIASGTPAEVQSDARVIEAYLGQAAAS